MSFWLNGLQRSFIEEWCSRGMITNQTFVNVVVGFPAFAYYFEMMENITGGMWFGVDRYENKSVPTCLECKYC